VKDDEDLAHYRDQPDRLIEEYKKMRMAKNKATQFAVDAKQTAQKVSTTRKTLQEHRVYSANIQNVNIH